MGNTLGLNVAFKATQQPLHASNLKTQQQTQQQPVTNIVQQPVTDNLVKSPTIDPAKERRKDLLQMGIIAGVAIAASAGATYLVTKGNPCELMNKIGEAMKPVSEKVDSIKQAATDKANELMENAQKLYKEANAHMTNAQAKGDELLNAAKEKADEQLGRLNILKARENELNVSISNLQNQENELKTKGLDVLNQQLETEMKEMKETHIKELADKTREVIQFVSSFNKKLKNKINEILSNKKIEPELAKELISDIKANCIEMNKFVG
ncbi:MAG: hypothetical protein WCK67_03430 [bacterium]